MKDSVMPVQSTFVVIDGHISALSKGFLILRDRLGHIASHAILHKPLSVINVSHIRTGIYEIQLIVGQTAISQAIFIG
jgi:hypothetical protein